nr:MAG: coat protein [Leviviridae sp.]
MPLNGMVLKDAATAISVTAGTDMTFTVDGLPVANGIHLSNAAQADFRLRENITAKYRPPVQNPDKSWKKGKWTVSYTEPSVDANGLMSYDVGRIEVELNPTSAASVGVNIRRMLAQLLTDTDLDNFYASGSQV